MFDLGQMVAILENDRFLRFAVNWMKTASRILMLEVGLSYTQIMPKEMYTGLYGRAWTTMYSLQIDL